MNSRGIQLSGGMGNEMSKLLGGNKYIVIRIYRFRIISADVHIYKREGMTRAFGRRRVN